MTNQQRAVHQNTRCGIYVRISVDRGGEGLGVQRQEGDCRALAGRRGWQVVELYVDNDISAFSSRRRPGFERMLADLKSQHINAVVVWHMDRLTRKPMELENFMDLCDSANIALASVQGDTDLATPSGRLFARQLGAFARYEQEHKSTRQKARNLQSALSGHPWAGGHRCYGYENDGRTVRDDEAQFLRDAAQRLLDGQSMRSTIAWLNQAGARTSTGGLWQPISLRRLLLNPRIAGLRTYRGKETGEGNWAPILSATTQQALARLLNDPSRRQNRTDTGRRYLLTGGLVMCGLCGQPLHSQPSNSGKRGYVCRTASPNAGCGRIRIAAEPLEAAVQQLVLDRLASAALRERLFGLAAQVDGLAPAETIEALLQKLAQLGTDYADNLIGREEFLAARQRISERLSSARRSLTIEQDLTDLPGFDAGTLTAWWEAATVERRRRLTLIVLDHINVAPATRRGPSGLDEGRLTWIWR